MSDTATQEVGQTQNQAASAAGGTLDFRNLLKKNSTEVERFKPLPKGHYFGLIGTHQFGKSSQKQTPYVRFMLQLTEPSEDVNPEELAEIENLDLTKREIRADYYITQMALARLSDMLDAVVGQPERSIEERIPETRGIPILVNIGQRDNEAGTQTFNEVRDLARDTRYD